MSQLEWQGTGGEHVRLAETAWSSPRTSATLSRTPCAIPRRRAPRAYNLILVNDLRFAFNMHMCMYCDLNATTKNRMRRYALTPLLDEPGGGGSCVRGAFFVRSMREVPH